MSYLAAVDENLAVNVSTSNYGTTYTISFIPTSKMLEDNLAQSMNITIDGEDLVTVSEKKVYTTTIDGKTNCFSMQIEYSYNMLYGPTVEGELEIYIFPKGEVKKASSINCNLEDSMCRVNTNYSIYSGDEEYNTDSWELISTTAGFCYSNTSGATVFNNTAIQPLVSDFLLDAHGISDSVYITICNKYRSYSTGNYIVVTSFSDSTISIGNSGSNDNGRYTFQEFSWSPDTGILSLYAYQDGDGYTSNSYIKYCLVDNIDTFNPDSSSNQYNYITFPSYEKLEFNVLDFLIAHNVSSNKLVYLVVGTEGSYNNDEHGSWNNELGFVAFTSVPSISEDSTTQACYGEIQEISGVDGNSITVLSNKPSFISKPIYVLVDDAFSSYNKNFRIAYKDIKLYADLVDSEESIELLSFDPSALYDSLGAFAVGSFQDGCQMLFEKGISAVNLYDHMKPGTKFRFRIDYTSISEYSYGYYEAASGKYFMVLSPPGISYIFDSIITLISTLKVCIDGLYRDCEFIKVYLNGQYVECDFDLV